MNKDPQNSLRGKLIKDVMAHFTQDLHIGKMAQTGELRRRLPDPAFIVPAGYNMTHIDRSEYTMELMTSARNPNFDGVILQLHGGGYVGAVRNKYYLFAKNYIDITNGWSVLTPDYRVAPENVFPAALEDAFDAYNWLLARGFTPDNIVLAGDSAGGGLCMALCMYLRDKKMQMPKAIVAMSPWTDVAATGESYDANFEKDPLFGNTRDSMIYNNPYPGDEELTNPYISPLYGEFEGFPPMLIQVGADEMLLSDSVSVADKAKAAGCDVKLSIYEGMFHVFQMCFQMIPESKDAWKEVEGFLGEII